MAPFAPLAHELVIVGLDGKQISLNSTVRHSSFVKKDGPRHTGRVEKIEWPRDSSPVIVVAMNDGTTQRWGTTWTSEGPWDLQAPFRTERGRKVRS